MAIFTTFLKCSWAERYILFIKSCLAIMSFLLIYLGLSLSICSIKFHSLFLNPKSFQNKEVAHPLSVISQSRHKFKYLIKKYFKPLLQRILKFDIICRQLRRSSVKLKQQRQMSGVFPQFYMYVCM